MALPKPEPGLVSRYSYLWLSEFLAGHEEGVKDRPCAIVAAFAQDSDSAQRVLVLPVTHSPPQNTALAIEIPPRVKRHLRLDEERSWIVLSESNEFLWSGPDLRHLSNDENTVAYGFLPPAFFAAIRQQFIALEGLLRQTHVRRTE